MPDSSVSSSPLGSSSGGGGLKGNVYGGRQPVAGAATYLYGASSSNYGSAGISLLGNIKSALSPDGKCDSSVKEPLYMDTSGNCYYLTGGTSGNTLDTTPGEFQLTGLYQCNVSSANAAAGSLPGQQVWLYSVGGTPGVVSGTQSANVQAGFTAALGTCPGSDNFSSDSFIYINEVSTVAFAYAVAGFATNATSIGSDVANYSLGFTTAFNNAAQLYDISGGSDPGDHGARRSTPNANGTNTPTEGNGATPYKLINTVADVIASCINTANPTALSSTPCAQVFDDAYGTGNVPTPSDTASLAIFVAQNPSLSSTANVSSFLQISDGLSPWLPNYASTGTALPSDLTAGISFSGVSSPVGIAIDASGNSYVTSPSSQAIYELSPKGNVTVSSSVGHTISYVTIDVNGFVWTPVTDSSQLVLQLTPGLTDIENSYSVPFSAENHQIAADSDGNVFIADSAGTLYEVSSAGDVIGGGTTQVVSKVCETGITGIAYANNGSTTTGIWTAGNDPGKTNSCFYSYSTKNVLKSTATLQIGSTPAYVATDKSANGWITTGSSDALFQVQPTGIVNQIFPGGGIDDPTYVTVDGGGNIWLVNQSGNSNIQANISSGVAPSLSEYSPGFGWDSAGAGRNSRASGYQYGLLDTPSDLAIDQAGDVWVTNTAANVVVELIGAATPTKAPLWSGPGVEP